MKIFSYIHTLPAHQHAELDFADVNVGRDNRLFVDPSRIHLAALAGNAWAKEADLLITSFFDALYTAAAQKDTATVCSLLRACGEINETQLGMSRSTPRGNGASVPLIFSAINQMMNEGLFEKKLVESIADVPIFADRVGADHLSDWTTNLIWPVLQDFTVAQYEKYSLQKDMATKAKRFRWDSNSFSWQECSAQYLTCNKTRILLCPKEFLHKRLLLSTENFLKSQVLVYRQQELLDAQSSLCRQRQYKDGSIVLLEPRKKDIVATEIGETSHTQYVRDSIKEHPHLLTDYHHRFEYQPNKEDYFISDSELDDILYKD